MTATSAKFQLDGKPASDEVFAAFFDKPYTVVFPSALERILEAHGDQATVFSPPETLPAEAITKMLAEKGGDWKLAVLKGDATGVLDGELLKESWDKGSGELTILLRSPTPGEKLVLDDSASLYGPSASWDRVKDAVGYPVAQVALVATAAGLFGLLALADNIQHPWAMKAATVVAAVAVGASVFYGQWQTETEVVPARLDLLRERQRSMFREAIKRAKLGLALLLVAVVLAIIATWPSGASKASATFGNPTVAVTAKKVRRARLNVTWSNLADKVATVSSTITGSATPTVTPKSADSSSVEQPLETTVPAGATSITVGTRALDDHGGQVGIGYTKALKLP